MKLLANRLVEETSQRLYGLSALMDLIDQAHPKSWEEGKEALKELATNSAELDLMQRD